MQRSLLVLLFILFTASVVHAQVSLTFVAPTTNTTVFTGGAQFLNITASDISTGNENVTNTTWYYSIDNGVSWTFFFSHNVSEDDNVTALNITFDSTALTDAKNFDINITVVGFDGTTNSTTLGVNEANNPKLDNTVPNSTVTLEDIAEQDITDDAELGYGNDLFINCNPNDDTSGLNTTRNSIAVRYPGLSSFENLSLTDNSATELKATIDGNGLEKIGILEIRCTVFDFAQQLNTSFFNLTLTSVVIKSLSPFADPTFEAPIANKVIGKGTIEDYGGKYGELPDQGIARLIKKLGAVSLMVNGESHTIKVIELDDEGITLEIASEPFTLAVGVNETVNVDVDADGIDDLEIYLHKIHTKAADLLIKAIATPSAVVVEDIIAPVDDTPVVAPPEEKTGSMTWLWTLLILVVIAVILMFILHKFSHKDEEGPGSVRFTPRDLGSNKENDAAWGMQKKEKGPFY